MAECGTSTLWRYHCLQLPANKDLLLSRPPHGNGQPGDSEGAGSYNSLSRGGSSRNGTLTQSQVDKQDLKAPRHCCKSADVRFYLVVAYPAENEHGTRKCWYPKGRSSSKEILSGSMLVFGGVPSTKCANLSHH